ncbi:hypothetical protein [Nocardioides dongxiaopingii]|uniref:hypothetical protein n=1 Tax=Nocardioides dongxiaopingii TaxID=2576036 RepID=UPI0010C7708B|nr:hypothetical protein [Nocardioides dongxiaopingii]
MSRLPLVWGATAAEVTRAYPADRAVDGPVVLTTRAAPVDAPVAVVWRWLCQMAVAPYSYDWVDNLGRRSPRELTPGADRLEPGQTMATVLALVDLVDGHHWTGLTRTSRPFGRVAMTYAAEPGPVPGSSRIVCRIAVGAGSRPGRVAAHALAWGDLVMIRKQLRTLGGLAERDARAR